jgi:hypothetical protein
VHHQLWLDRVCHLYSPTANTYAYLSLPTGLASNTSQFLMLNSLQLLCHLAATPAGRRCMAESACLPRWLLQLQHVQPWLRPLLLQLPLACLTKWDSRQYWCLLHTEGQWAAGQIATEGVKSDALNASSDKSRIKQQVTPPATRPCGLAYHIDNNITQWASLVAKLSCCKPCPKDSRGI